MSSVAFSPDGELIVSTGLLDGTIRLWEVESQTEVDVIRGQNDFVRSVSFSPDGKLFASTGGWEDNKVWLWDAETREKVVALKGHTVYAQSVSFSHANVTILSVDADTIYQADYYNDQRETLTNTVILIRDSEGGFSLRIDADWAEWNGRNWVLHNSRIYRWEQDQLRDKQVAIYDEEGLAEPPSTFRKVTRDVDEMKALEAKDWVFRLKKAGLPYRETLTKYYKKYFFALSPFIVCLIAAGVGGRFKKNVMLMNLLVSLIISVIYYVLQMISLILAKNGYIPPMAGAGAAFIIFLVVGLFLLRSART